MPDNQVEIVFRSIAELQGALAAQAELEKTRGKLLALGKDTLEVDAQLARANALVAQAPPEMLDAAKLQEQASGFEHLNLKGREFHRVLHEISAARPASGRSEEHTSELQSRLHLVCRLLLEKKKRSLVKIEELVS